MHGLLSLNNLEIEANKEEVLTALRTNLANHKEILEDARKAFVVKARKRLEFELGKIGKGKTKSINISLHPPQDHSSEYETAIKMLELHRGETVTLEAAQVRYLLEDRWDWMTAFLLENIAYSNKARDLASYHGIDAEAELAAAFRAQEEETGGC